MDSLLQLINNQIQKALSKSAHINSEIAQVVSTDGVTATVKLFAVGTEYTLPNYSGSDIKVGDTVYVYWRGGFFSPQSAYIGTSTRTDFPLTYVNGTDTTGAMGTAGSQIQIESVTDNCTINLIFNSVVSATSVGNFSFTIYVNNVAESYVPSGTTIADGNVHCNFAIPLSLPTKGDYTIAVQSNGSGTVAQMKSYCYGQGMREGGTNG